MVKRTTRKKGGASMALSKQEILRDPMIQKALRAYAQQGSGRMMGRGWWEDFVGFLKKNKVVSTGSKIGSMIATASGNVPLATALSGISTGASTLGFGKRGGAYAQSIAMPSSSSVVPFLKF
jgi:hypothetical protein